MHAAILMFFVAILAAFRRVLPSRLQMKKAFSDLWINPGRTALVIFALVIGLWGVGSLMVSNTVLQRDLRENFTGTLPPHAILISKEFDRLDLAAFRSRPEVESAEFRDLSLQRIEVHPDEWIPVWLFGVEDFSHFNLAQIHPEKGKQAPEPGGLLMERDGIHISDLTLGTSARIRAAGRIVEVPVSGIAFDPAQAPATQDHFIYAYVDKKTFSQITQEKANQRLIFRLKNVKSKQEIEAATNRIIDNLKSEGIILSNVQIPKLNEHPHQWQLNTLLLLEGSIGLLAFLMGAVLVSQLMAAILSRQVRQIGILKAVGASTFQVMQIYLAMVLALGLIATAIAIPLAVWTGYGFSRLVADQLNFNLLTSQLSVHFYLLFLAAGLLMPLLLSLPALLKGVRLSVHQALGDYGIQPESSGKSKNTSFNTALPTFLVMAFRNSMRRKRRLILTILTMALGVAIFSTGFNVRESLWVLLTEVKESMKHDVQVVLRQQVEKEKALAPFRSIGNLDRIETWNGGRGELQARVISADNGVGIVALPYDTRLFNAKIEKGRWLQKSREPEVVLNQPALDLYGKPKVGEKFTLKLAGKEVPVKLVGVVWELEKAKIYMDQDWYDSVANPDHKVNSLMFVAKEKSYDSVMAMKKEVEKAIAPTDLDVLYVMSQAERVQVIYDHLNIILSTILFLALLVLVVSALGMASATGINIMERTREIGVLRAIGATPGTIYKLFVAEGMMVSLASVALGLLLSLPLSKAAAPFFGNLMLGEGAALPFAFSVTGFWITLVTTIVFGWLASRIPARKAIQVSTREALAYE